MDRNRFTRRRTRSTSVCRSEEVRKQSRERARERERRRARRRARRRRGGWKPKEKKKRKRSELVLSPLSVPSLSCRFPFSVPFTTPYQTLLAKSSLCRERGVACGKKKKNEEPSSFRCAISLGSLVQNRLFVVISYVSDERGADLDKEGGTIKCKEPILFP
jgi:hypothetical protein